MIDDVQTEERDDIFHDDELIRSLLNENNADDLLIHALLTDDVEEYGDIFFFDILMSDISCPVDSPIRHCSKK